MSALAEQLVHLHLLRPWWLLALLLVPALAWWSHRQARRRSAWRDAVDPHLLPHLLESASGDRPARWTHRLGMCAAVLAILAMAGPSFRKDERPLWQTRAPLVVALDLSSATLARDLPPNRLAQARAKLATLLRERAGGQVALVAFAGDAFTVAPLTEDADNVALFLDALAPDVMPEDGHRADRAIAWSQGLLAQAGFDRGDILLLTDRADGTDIAAAAKARAAGYRVSVLGMGSEQGGVFDSGGSLGQARLDAAALRRLAAGGGGAYSALTPGDADLRAVDVLAPRDEGATAARGQKAAGWRDDGYWLLPLAMLLCLPLFRRGNALALLLGCAFCLPLASPPAQAQARAQAPAAREQGGDLWRRADQAAHARMQEGIAAYRQKDYPRAIERFLTVPGADAQYNLGNALAQAGRYDDAIAAYDRALKLQPGLDGAAFNRALVQVAKHMPKKQQDQGQDGKKGQQDQKRKQQDQQQGKQQGQQAPQSQQGGQQQRQPPPAQQPKPDTQPQDAQAQQQADAAQRQRMQEALQERQGGQGDRKQQAQAARGERKETPEERERRMANQAWLQRVPDDPGALLRARFLLEQRRREGKGP